LAVTAPMASSPDRGARPLAPRTMVLVPTGRIRCSTSTTSGPAKRAWSGLVRSGVDKGTGRSHDLDGTLTVARRHQSWSPGQPSNPRHTASRNGEDRMSARTVRNRTARRLSWLMVAGLTAGALLVPAASASATESHQDLPIVGNDFNNQDCSDGLGAGWIFVNTSSHDETGT